MSLLSRSTFATAPRNLCELLLRDITSLLITSRSVAQSLTTLRPQCDFSPEVVEKLDAIISVSRNGENHLDEPLREGGIVLPVATANGASALVVNFFTRLPEGAAPGVLATEIMSNLRMFAQHVELKARLAGEEALLVGQKALCRALFKWAAEWRTCSQNLRATTVRALAQAYIADLPSGAADTASSPSAPPFTGPLAEAAAS